MRLTRLQAKKHKKYYTVYRITNKINGLSYIGAHRVLNNGKKDKYICSSKSVLELVRKNPENFTRTILRYYSTALETDKAEKELIKKYNTFHNGYNRTEDGGKYRAHGIDLLHRGLTSKEAKNLLKKLKKKTQNITQKH